MEVVLEVALSSMRGYFQYFESLSNLTSLELLQAGEEVEELVLGGRY